MSENATDPPARPANITALRTIGGHGSSLTDLLIQLEATSAMSAGTAIAALISGRSWAAASTGMRNSPCTRTSDVQLSGDVTPVRIVNAATTARSPTNMATAAGVRRPAPAKCGTKTDVAHHPTSAT